LVHGMIYERGRLVVYPPVMTYACNLGAREDPGRWRVLIPSPVRPAGRPAPAGATGRDGPAAGPSLGNPGVFLGAICLPGWTGHSDPKNGARSLPADYRIPTGVACDRCQGKTCKYRVGLWLRVSTCRGVSCQSSFPNRLLRKPLRRKIGSL